MQISLKGVIFIILSIVFGIAGIYLISINLKGYAIFSVSVAVVLILMGVTLIIENSTPERMYYSNIKEILNTFDSILVKSTTMPNLEGRNIIVLEDIDDLVDAQLEIRKPICYIKQTESCSFVLLDEKEAYICVEKLNDSVISPVEIELSNIRTRLKRKEELDMSMIKDIEKTTIVKLSNKKSYKVSPIKESKDEIIESIPKVDYKEEVVEELDDIKEKKLDVKESKEEEKKQDEEIEVIEEETEVLDIPDEDIEKTNKIKKLLENTNTVELLDIDFDDIPISNSIVIEPIRRLTHEEYLELKKHKSVQE